MREHEFILSRRTFLGGTAIVGASLFLPAITPLEAHAVTAAEKQAEADAALDQLNALQQKLGQAENDHWAALQELEAAQERMDEAQGRIDEASSRISDLQGQLGQRARSMYRSGSTSFLDLLLGSTTFQAFASNWDLLNDMNENDAEMVEETKTLREHVESEKAVYEEQREVADRKTKEAEEVAEEAQRLVEQTEQVYNSLSAEAAELLEEERKAREAAEAVAAAAREEEARRQQQQQQSNNDNDNSSNNNNNNSTPPPAADDGTIVGRAKAQLGKPYVWGATGPDSYDCSGLVGYCLTGHHSRIGVAASFMSYPQVSNPQPGDICCNSYHCGIYVGGGQMIHAPEPGDVVKYGPVFSDMIITRA